MNDRELKIEAMYQVEAASELLFRRGAGHPGEYGTYPPYVVQELEKRLAAAVYLIQAMMGGYVPENFDEILGEAREIDAEYETKELLSGLRKRRLDNT